MSVWLWLHQSSDDWKRLVDLVVTLVRHEQEWIVDECRCMCKVKDLSMGKYVPLNNRIPQQTIDIVVNSNRKLLLIREEDKEKESF